MLFSFSLDRASFGIAQHSIERGGSNSELASKRQREDLDKDYAGNSLESAMFGSSTMIWQGRRANGNGCTLKASFGLYCGKHRRNKRKKAN
jgi:hypothetical protein